MAGKITDDHFTHNYKFTDRTRYLISLTVPLWKDPHLPQLVIADELAVQFGREVLYNSFDQNRFFVGIRQQLSPTLAFDFGYMQVFQQKSSGYQYGRNHMVRWFFYYTPDFREKITRTKKQEPKSKIQKEKPKRKILKT